MAKKDDGYFIDEEKLKEYIRIPSDNLETKKWIFMRICADSYSRCFAEVQTENDSSNNDKK